MITKTDLNELTFRILGAAIEVHKALGPGLLESVYHKCLKQELFHRGLNFTSELIVPIFYKGIEVKTDLRCDLLIEDLIVGELKTVELFAPVHEAQILTYMKLLEKPKGILLNFYCANLFKEGQRTYVNEYFRILPD